MEEIVLPLYSRSGETKFVQAKSGLNQWLAGGRRRQLGECYIPVPKAVREKAPDFFPARDEKFSLYLPGDLRVDAKVCQADSKALMSSPNHHLCGWIFAQIDISPELRWERYVTRNAYTYEDLKQIGFDCVSVIRRGEEYFLNPATLGKYEDWLLN